MKTMQWMLALVLCCLVALLAAACGSMRSVESTPWERASWGQVRHEGTPQVSSAPIIEAAPLAAERVMDEEEACACDEAPPSAPSGMWVATMSDKGFEVRAADGTVTMVSMREMPAFWRGR